MTYVYAVIGLYLVMSCAAFIAFWLDKRKASKGQWRTPEKTLLLLCALFGWPGGLLAMRFVRHKTRKRKFTVGVPLIAGLHLAFWIALAGWWFNDYFTS